MLGWEFWIGVIATVLLLFSSTLKAALRAPSRVRLAEQFEATGRLDVLDQFVSLRPRFLLTASIVRSLALLMLFIATAWHLDIPGSDSSPASWLAAGGIVWAILLIFGIAIPQAWAKYAGELLISRIWIWLVMFLWVGRPLVWFLEQFDPLVRRLCGVPVRDAQFYADELEQEILNVVSEGEKAGAVDEEEKEMIESVIELGDMTVDAIMTPRTDIVALPKEGNRDSVIDIVSTEGHSRIPVYEDTIDTILGVLYVKDLLRQASDQPFDITRMMRSALFMPESKPVRELLREFQAKKVHIAIVLDEYGGTAGLVTIEDILEELVGEIVDEYETETPAEIQRLDDTTVEVDARLRIHDLNDELNVDLPDDEDYETIGGFVFSTLGRIPKVGDQCNHQDVNIRVIAADARRVLRLRLDLAKIGDAPS